MKGRGAEENPKNRFERIAYEPEPGHEGPGPRTEFYRDVSRSVISRNDSPDIGFETSLNPYRGCEHGCAYCYARPFHEFLGFSAGLDFESKILVKEDAPELLRKELSANSWKPQVLVLSGVTDPYQPIERRLGLTRRCLEVLAEFGNPVAVITKNHLVARDADLLGRLASSNAASVTLSITTLDADLARALEPRASTPALRLEAIRSLAEAGVQAGVNVAPVIPGLTEHETPAILEAAAKAGATHAGFTVLRLPGAVAELFESWLMRHVPGKREKILRRIRKIRGGALHDPRFHSRMRGEGIFAEQIRQLFELGRRRAGIPNETRELSAAAFRRPDAQLRLF